MSLRLKVPDLLTVNEGNSSRIFGLDLMRAVAITAVVVAHSRGLLSPFGWDLDFLRFSAFAGVEIFFVLSGFLIGSILIKTIEANNRFSFQDLKGFWIRRWFRTLPNYYLMLSVLLIAHTLMNDPVPFDWRYLVFLQNFVTPHPAFFGEAWSLSVEEWFYLLFPLGVLTGCMMLPFRSKKQVILLVVIAFIVGFNAMRYYYAVNFDPQWNLGVRRMVFCRLDSIMYGVLGAWMAFYKPAFWKSMRLPGVAAGILIGLFSVWHFFTDLNPVKMAYGSLFSNTAFFTVFSVSIACFLPFLSNWRKANVNILTKVVTHVSVVSYSVYLVHFALVYKGFNLLSFSGTPFLVLLKYVLYWVVVLLISTVNYNLFEKPVTRLRERFFKGG